MEPRLELSHLLVSTTTFPNPVNLAATSSLLSTFCRCALSRSAKYGEDGAPKARLEHGKRVRVDAGVESSLGPDASAGVVVKRAKKVVQASAEGGHVEAEEQTEAAAEEGCGTLSKEQKMRMELNKGTARALRNFQICEERVAQAIADGKRLPDLKDLLVEPSWREVLDEEFTKSYMRRVRDFVEGGVISSKTIYPPPAYIFNAFNTCPYDKVKVVLVGQDPYHGPRQAMGLCFSVPKGVKVPSSLINIFKEIQSDVGCSIPSHGNLQKWAHQGVLLLNAVLTVQEHMANSHAKIGWEDFTDRTISAVSCDKKGVVFLLWGNSAQAKARHIDAKKHHILKAAHPSGLSAHKGFFKCRHFSKTNELLEKSGELPIDWQL